MYDQLGNVLVIDEDFEVDDKDASRFGLLGTFLSVCVLIVIGLV